MLPPPRAMTRTSSGFQASLGALSSRMASAISSAAPAPCTRTGLISTSTPGARRRRTFRISLDGRAAGRGDDADAARKFRQRAFARRLEKSFGFELALQRLELRLQQTDAARLQDLHVELVLPARFEDGDLPETCTCMPSVSGLGNGGSVFRKITQLIAARWSLRVKYWWPEGSSLVVGNFALHPDRAEARLEQAANRAGQLRDGENPGDVREKIVCVDACGT